MKAKKKKKSLNSRGAAQKISSLLWDFLKTLSTAERNKRLDKFHKSVRARVASAKASSAGTNTRQKHGEPTRTVPTRLVARSGQETVILRPQAEESFDYAQDRPHGVSGS